MERLDGFHRFVLDRYKKAAYHFFQESLASVTVCWDLDAVRNKEVADALGEQEFLYHAWTVDFDVPASGGESDDERETTRCEKDTDRENHTGHENDPSRPTYVLRTNSGVFVYRPGDGGYSLGTMDRTPDPSRNDVHDVRVATTEKVKHGVVLALFRRCWGWSNERRDDDAVKDDHLTTLTGEPAFEELLCSLDEDGPSFLLVGCNPIGDEFFYDLHSCRHQSYHPGEMSTADRYFFYRKRMYTYGEFGEMMDAMMTNHPDQTAELAAGGLCRGLSSPSGRSFFDPLAVMRGSKNVYPLLYESDRMTDVTIVLEGTEFRLHRLVLLTESRLFNAMIETNPNATLLVCGAEDFVEGERVDADEFADLVRFWYLKELPPNATAARKLRVLYLVDLFDRTVS